MSASETVAGQIEYMSKRLLEVAESNTILDDFGKSKVGYKFVFKSVPINQDWIRIVRERQDWEEFVFSGLNFAESFETRELSTLDRLRLEEELPF